MSNKRNLADVLGKMLAVSSNHYLGVSFRTDETSACAFCSVDPDVSEHELWCAWVIGRTFSASDITAVERLVRVLRYEV